MGSDEDSAASDSGRALCTDCGERPPPTHSAHSLISAQHGWRLQLRELPDGTKEPVWRCRSCWQKFKESSTH